MTSLLHFLLLASPCLIHAGFAPTNRRFLKQVIVSVINVSTVFWHSQELSGQPIPASCSQFWKFMLHFVQVLGQSGDGLSHCACAPLTLQSIGIAATNNHYMAALIPAKSPLFSNLFFITPICLSILPDCLLLKLYGCPLLHPEAIRTSSRHICKLGGVDSSSLPFLFLLFPILSIFSLVSSVFVLFSSLPFSFEAVVKVFVFCSWASF